MKRPEHKEQSAVVSWFRLQYPQYKGCLFAIPNGGDRHPLVAAKLKAEGTLAGVSDLFLMVPRPGCCGMFIEMKAVGGRLQANQREFQELARRMGYKAVTCYGFDEARKEIGEYLGCE